MDKTLHILNGESAAGIFSKSGLQGEMLVWREMLCEGKLNKDVGSDDFWKVRYQFFEEELDIKRLDYFDGFIKEILKIQDTSNYTEAVLWFEYDLFCQVNLLAACTYLLKNYRKDIRYSLICTGKEKDKERLQNLSDYSSEQYNTLYKNRIKLTRNDLLFAQESWDIYVENNKETLKDFDFDRNKKFIYLQKSMDQHLQRFPDKNGLDQIDYKIIRLVKKGITNEIELIKELLSWQRDHTVYGFGDTQYQLKIKSLKERMIV